MAAPALRNIATPQHRSSTTNTASTPALQAQHPHQQQQQHDQHIISTSNCTRGTLVTQRQHGAEPQNSSPHITSASAHRHSQAPFRSKLVPMPQYADSPNPSRLFNSAASAMNAAGASFAPHRRSPVLRRPRPRAHDRVVSRRFAALHRVAPHR